VACHTTRQQRELLRVVRGPDGAVRLDGSGRSNGRGAYVCRDAECIAAATHRGGLARALTAPIPPALAAELAAAAKIDPAATGGTRGKE
jgi:predicted RNA-binding protein YlxR (DUF448 family)